MLKLCWPPRRAPPTTGARCVTRRVSRSARRNRRAVGHQRRRYILVPEGARWHCCAKASRAHRARWRRACWFAGARSRRGEPGPGARAARDFRRSRRVREPLARCLQPARGQQAANFAEVRSLFPGLAERRRQIVRTMSGGLQQMLALGVSAEQPLARRALPRLVVAAVPVAAVPGAVPDVCGGRLALGGEKVRQSGSTSAARCARRNRVPRPSRRRKRQTAGAMAARSRRRPLGRLQRQAGCLQRSGPPPGSRGAACQGEASLTPRRHHRRSADRRRQAVSGQQHGARCQRRACTTSPNCGLITIPVGAKASCVFERLSSRPASSGGWVSGLPAAPAPPGARPKPASPN